MKILSLLAILSLALPSLADEEKIYGAPLIGGARKLEEGRYRSPRNYDDTVDWYAKLYKGNPCCRFKAIVNMPGVKAVHLLNAKGDGWTGLNIYEVSNETRLFVLKAPDKPADRKRKKK